MCLYKCTAKGGWRTQEQSGSTCPLYRRALGEGDLCVSTERLTGRTAVRRMGTIRSRPGALMHVMDEGRPGCKTGGLLRKKEGRWHAKKGKGRTTAPISRSGLTPLLRRGGVRIPWELNSRRGGEFEEDA